MKRTRRTLSRRVPSLFHRQSKVSRLVFQCSLTSQDHLGKTVFVRFPRSRPNKFIQQSVQFNESDALLKAMARKQHFNEIPAYLVCLFDSLRIFELKCSCHLVPNPDLS
jgi:hypothetical protein